MSSPFAATATGNLLPHLLLPAVQILAFTLPPFHYRSHIFVPIILALIYGTWSNLCSDAVDVRGFMIGQWPWYLSTLEKLLFHPVPEKEYWRVDKPAQEAMSMPLLSKLKWSAALYVNPRGIGWNYQVKGIPEQRASDTRRGFFIQQFKEIAVVYLALDVLNIYTSRYYYKPGVDPLTLTIRADTWPRGIWNAYSGMANQVLTTSYLHLQIATFSVLLGGSQPKDWPPLYGSFTEAYTIRRYWNTFWHQITRHMFVAYSRDLRAILHIRRGTWLSSYFDLYFTFTFSALFHGITMYAMPYGPNHSFNLRFMMWFHFMFWQAPAIQFEDLVIWCYKRIVGTTEGKVLNEEQQRQRRSETNVRTWHRIVGYIWVFGWWYYILPWPVDTVLRFEIAKASPLPFSVLNPVLTWAENITSSSG